MFKWCCGLLSVKHINFKLLNALIERQFEIYKDRPALLQFLKYLPEFHHVSRLIKILNHLIK